MENTRTTTQAERSEGQPQSECMVLMQQTKARLIKFYDRLDRRAKLAIVLLSEIRALDGINFDSRTPRAERLIDRIDDLLDSACRDPFEDPEEQWAATLYEGLNLVMRCM